MNHMNMPSLCLKFILGSCFLFLNINAFTQDTEWTLQATTESGSQIFALDEQTLAKDNQGNYFVSGTVIDPTEFGSFTISGNEFIPDFYLNASYVAKINGVGEPQWIKTYSGTAGGPLIYDSVTDELGNLYILAGTFSQGDFEGNLIDGGEMLLAKYNTDGELLWHAVSESQSGVNRVASGSSVDISPNGNVVVSGYIHREIRFQSVVLDAFESHFMASYDSDGNLNWARSYGHSYDLEQQRDNSEIAIDEFDNIYMVGMTKGSTIDGTSIFDDIILDANIDMFLAKFDEFGDVIWLNHYKSPVDSFDKLVAEDITIDENDNSIIIAGYFEDEVTFGNTTLTATDVSGNQFFIAKFDSDGNDVWAKQSHGPANRMSVFDLDANEHGELFVAFSVRVVNSPGNELVLGEGNNAITFPINGIYNGIIAKYNTDGNLDWLKGMDGFNENLFVAIQAVGDNSAIVSGRFTGTVQLGSAQLSATPSASTHNYILALCDGDKSTGIFNPTAKAQSLNIYPNPAQENITIELPSNHELEYLGLYSLEGILIKEIKTRDRKINLNIEDLMPGIYFISNQNRTAIYNQKLIIH